MKTVIQLGEPLPFVSSSEWGGKGKNLLELGEFFNVPSGIVLNVDAYHAFVQESNLADRIKEVTDVLKGQEAEEKVKELFLQGKHPDNLAQEILQSVSSAGLSFPLAVRSSGVDEDGCRNSFAGQHETILGVANENEIEEAIRLCYASLYSARAIEYRKSRGLAEPSGIALVVQTMINPDVAGVAYSASPTDLGYVLIEATYGLGTSVVDGKGVDSFRASSGRDRDIVSKINKHKKEKRVWSNWYKQIVTKAVKKRLWDQPCLNEKQINEIADLAIEVEKFFSVNYPNARKPQDIEWAYSGSSLYLLQSRPITGMDIHTPDFELPDLSKIIGDSYNVGKKGEYEGPVVIIESVDSQGTHFQVKGGENIRELNEKFKDGYVLVTPETNPTLDSYLTNCKAIVTTECGIMSHAGATAREKDIIFIGCVESSDNRNLIDILDNGEEVVVAGNKSKGIIGYR